MDVQHALAFLLTSLKSGLEMRTVVFRKSNNNEQVIKLPQTSSTGLDTFFFFF